MQIHGPNAPQRVPDWRIDQSSSTAPTASPAPKPPSVQSPHAPMPPPPPHRSLPLAAATACVAVLLVLAGGCQPEAASDAGERASSAAPPTQTFGEDVDRSAAVPATAVPDRAMAYDGKSVTVRGSIREVCQAQGCWLALDTGDHRPVRVLVPRTDDGYGFTVPTDASGEAVVHGTLRVASLDRPTRDHYADDGAARPDSVEVQIAARGIALTRGRR